MLCHYASCRDGDFSNLRETCESSRQKQSSILSLIHI